MSNQSIPQAQKCIIKNLDTKEKVEANFNPKELTIEKSIPWNKHKSSKGDNPVLEFTDAEPKSLAIELLFDTYESRENVYTKHVRVLESFTLIMGGSGANADKKRPPMCMFLWGRAFPSFLGVIESLSTKYTMFLTDGTPVRATCTIKMKQAEKLTKSGDKAVPIDDYGKIATEEDAMRPDKFGDDHRKTLERSGSDDATLQPGQQVPGTPDYELE